MGRHPGELSIERNKQKEKNDTSFQVKYALREADHYGEQQILCIAHRICFLDRIAVE